MVLTEKEEEQIRAFLETQRTKIEHNQQHTHLNEEITTAIKTVKDPIIEKHRNKIEKIIAERKQKEEAFIATFA